jgi:phosphoribosylamine--glycine ligase
MRILVVGSGGREHALVWKLKQSPVVEAIFCAPGNAGIGTLAQCIDISALDIDSLVDFAAREKIRLTVIGPEVPLAQGIVDRFEAAGLRTFGPRRKAAQLEGSKVFMKDLLQKYRIPSARSASFTDREAALHFIDGQDAPLVVKTDGLAAGKGVIVAESIAEARDAVDLFMKDKAFGEAGSRVVVEEFLRGEEASFLAFTDGRTILPLPSCQDHKAVYDGDRGPNTGGMGAYSPAPVVTGELHNQVMEKIMFPVVRALAAEGCPYKGVLYAGLMIENGEAKVLEFNCRFGDPEAQPLLMRLKSDLVEVMEAVIDDRLDTVRLEIDPRPAVCVVMAAGGYPGSYEKGKVIQGLDQAGRHPDVMVFHAGTARQGQDVVTNGGRVLGVTALGDTVRDAIAKVYTATAEINWDGCFYRKDIGHRALKREGGES